MCVCKTSFRWRKVECKLCWRTNWLIDCINQRPNGQNQITINKLETFYPDWRPILLKNISKNFRNNFLLLCKSQTHKDVLTSGRSTLFLTIKIDIRLRKAAFVAICVQIAVISYEWRKCGTTLWAEWFWFETLVWLRVCPPSMQTHTHTMIADWKTLVKQLPMNGVCVCEDWETSFWKCNFVVRWWRLLLAPLSK